MSFNFSTSDDWSKLFNTANIALILVTALIFYSGFRQGKAKDREVAQINQASKREIALANSEAAKANATAAKANAEAAKANEGLAKANTEIAKANAKSEEAVAGAAEARLKQEELRQQNIQLSTRLNEAIADAHITKTALVQAQESLAKAQQKQAEAQLLQQKSLEVVKKRQKPRVLTLVQQKQLAQFLSGRPKGFIKIVCALGDDESLSFASQLDQTIRSAGWGTVGVSQANFSINPIGLAINLEPTLNGALAVPRANALFQGITLIGLTVQHSGTIGLPGVGMETNSPNDNTLELVVGIKPVSAELPDTKFEFHSPYNNSTPNIR